MGGPIGCDHLGIPARAALNLRYDEEGGTDGHQVFCGSDRDVGHLQVPDEGVTNVISGICTGHTPQSTDNAAHREGFAGRCTKHRTAQPAHEDAGREGRRRQSTWRERQFVGDELDARENRCDPRRDRGAHERQGRLTESRPAALGRPCDDSYGSQRPQTRGHAQYERKKEKHGAV